VKDDFIDCFLHEEEVVFEYDEDEEEEVFLTIPTSNTIWQQQLMTA